MKTEQRQYLGDAVYLTYGEFGITLSTSDGIRATNVIVLEPEVIHGLIESLKKSPLSHLVEGL